MDDFIQYITPELMILIPVIYGIGIALKNSEIVADKQIPLVLGVTGIVLACVWEFTKLGFSGEALFAALTQGILCACAAVYVNQLYRQSKKEE